MKFCSKCGMQLIDAASVCGGCGTCVKADSDGYEDALACSMTCCIISGILLFLGILIALLFSILLGVLLCLGAEIVAVIPNTKVQNIFKKRHYDIADKTALKEKKKILKQQLGESNAAFKFSFVLSAVSLLFLILFAALM